MAQTLLDQKQAVRALHLRACIAGKQSLAQALYTFCAPLPQVPRLATPPPPHVLRTLFLCRHPLPLYVL